MNNTQVVLIKEIDAAAIKSTKIRELETDDKILHKKYQEKIKAIAEGINQNRQVYPILIRELTADEKKESATEAKYGIIDGHTRFEAMKLLKKDSIRVEILNDIDDKTISIISNFSKADMVELDKAKLVYDMNQNRESYQQIANKIGISKSYAAKLGKMWERYILSTDEKNLSLENTELLENIEKIEEKTYSASKNYINDIENYKSKPTSEKVKTIEKMKEYAKDILKLANYYESKSDIQLEIQNQNEIIKLNSFIKKIKRQLIKIETKQEEYQNKFSNAKSEKAKANYQSKVNDLKEDYEVKMQELNTKVEKLKELSPALENLKNIIAKNN